MTSTRVLTSSVAPEAGNPPSLSWTIYGPAEFDEAFYHWSQLEHRLNSASLTCSSLWVKNWIKHFGQTTPYKILRAHSAGNTRGMAMITQSTQKKSSFLTLHTRHLGTAGEPEVDGPFVEYNRLLVEEEYSLSFINGLCDHAARELNWDLFCIDGFHESDLAPFLKRYPQAEVQKRECRYFDFEKARSQPESKVIDHLGKSTRSNLKRRMKSYDPVRVEWASSVDRADDIFQEMVQLHQARWQSDGLPGAFASQIFTEFQRDLMVQGVIDGKVVLFRVRTGDRTLGCLMLLVDRGRLLDYLSGFADFKEMPSGGLVTHYLCMNEALDKGFRAYDFLVGDKQHKSNLSTDSTYLCWAKVPRNTMKMRVINGLRRIKSCMKHSAAPVPADR